ncbi:MAG: hypothetical protein FWH50_02885, partial [Coriobacteriia bacterium]|nr:hypothetical protein [Coriobacteriia bacterium]
MTNVKDSLNPPLLPSSVVERPEVNKAIDDAFRSDVIFMHAPAGFGKTIAMSSWLLARGRPTAWIPLTVYDDEPVVFCRYLLTALASLESGAAVAGVADAASAALNDPGFYEAPFEFLFQAITGLSTNKNRGVIVIDDFHLVKNTAILNKLPLLVSKLSQHLKLAFISRLNPPLSFADLALKGRLGEISESDLRFTSRQIMLLYQACGVDLSPAQAKTIADKTGGWALGLGAELLAVKARGSDSFMSQAAGERYIDSYLESEIWDNWDGETRVFLLRTSILEDLPPELCDRFCGGDSNRLLTRLMHESGLVVRLADGTFRYHHILRDFLRRQAVFLGTDLSGDYIVAADYLYARDNLNAAFDCYMKSGDQGAIIGFLAKIVDYGATTGSVEEYYNSINSYLYGKLPEELIEQNPFMLAPCVWLSLLSGDIMRFQHWMAKLQGFFDGDQTGIEQAGVEQADGDQAGVDPRFLAAITLFQFPNPLNSPRDILRYASARFDLMDFQSVPSPSVTYNLPYFHRGHRDYSDLAGEWEELVPQYVAAFNAISDNAISLIMDGVVSGLLYEQNKLPQAKQKAVEVLTRLDERSHPELWFSAYMHLAAIAFAEGEQEAAWDAISQAQAVIEKRGR